MPKFKKPALLTEQELNIIRGKASVGHASPEELLSVFGHYDLIEMKLDELDGEDYFGTEGWRHSFRLPDAD
jgi:hypothetical protein